VTGQFEDEMILVPRNPTKEMLEAAWADALGEDAAGVWKSMIENWESSSQQREFGNRQG
jgi:hypothetical protein